MVDVRPRQLGDVNEAVDPVEVDERAEVDDVGDRALDDLAGLQPVEDPLAILLALLLEHGATRQHDVVAATVELDHLALDRLAHVLVEIGHAADVDQRRGQEAAHAEVDDQPALDDLDHGALDGLAGLGGGLDPAPGLLEAGALLGQDQPAVLVLLGEDQRVDLLAELDLVAGVDRLADRQLAGGDDPLGLVADVDEHLVVVDPDDVAGDDIPLREGMQRGVVVGDDLTVDLEQQAIGAFDDLRVGSSVGRIRVEVEDMYPRIADGGSPAVPIVATAVGTSVSSAPMPPRATKRGEQRTPLDRDCDVLICGASFAGLAVARELARSGADVMVVDRYEIGERQTSACGIPTTWLTALDLEDSPQQTFGELVIHTPHTTVRYDLPWTFSTFDYRTAVRAARRAGIVHVRDRQGRGPPPARIDFRVRLAASSGAATSSIPTGARSARR